MTFSVRSFVQLNEKPHSQKGPSAEIFFQDANTLELQGFGDIRQGWRHLIMNPQVFSEAMMLIIMVHPKKTKNMSPLLWNHFFGHLILLSKTQLFDNSFNSRFQKYHMCCCNSRWQRFHLQHHTWHHPHHGPVEVSHGDRWLLFCQA